MFVNFQIAERMHVKKKSFSTRLILILLVKLLFCFILKLNFRNNLGRKFVAPFWTAQCKILLLELTLNQWQLILMKLKLAYLFSNQNAKSLKVSI